MWRGRWFYQVTVNFAEVKYIRHEEFATVEERSPNFNPKDKKTSFVFEIGEKVSCVFKDGKRMKGFVLSEGAYYLYIKTEKGNYCTIMKSALSYIAHVKHTPLLELNDFYIEEMKTAGHKNQQNMSFLSEMKLLYVLLMVRMYLVLFLMKLSIGYCYSLRSFRLRF